MEKQGLLPACVEKKHCSLVPMFFACVATCVVSVILSVLACEYFDDKKNVYDNHINNLAQQNRELSVEIVTLKQDNQKLQAKIDDVSDHVMKQKIRVITVSRNKWKAWMALKCKLDSSIQYNDEWNKFCTEFSDDPEIIALVRSVLPESETNAAKDSCTFLNDVVDKLIKFKKIDQVKILEISGYVLTSIVTAKDCANEKPV